MTCPHSDLNIITVMEQNDKFDMNVFDEPQCEEVYHDDDKHGSLSRPDDNKPHQRPVHDHDGWEGHWAENGSGMDDFADSGMDDFADYQNEGRDY